MRLRPFHGYPLRQILAAMILTSCFSQALRHMRHRGHDPHHRSRHDQAQANTQHRNNSISNSNTRHRPLLRRELEHLEVYRRRGLDLIPRLFEARLRSPCFEVDTAFPEWLLEDIEARARLRAKNKGKKFKGLPWLRARGSSKAGSDLDDTGGIDDDGGEARRLLMTTSRKGGRPGAEDSNLGEKVYSLAMYLRDNGIPRRLGFLCLPSFMLLGVPKSGTTALFEMIAAHPDVIRTRKEPHWWTRAKPGDTALHYIMQNYYAASQTVANAYFEGRDKHGKLPSQPSSSALLPPSKRQTPRRQLIFGDCSASTFWQLYHNPGGGSNATSAVLRGSDDDHGSSKEAGHDPSIPSLLRAIYSPRNAFSSRSALEGTAMMGGTQRLKLMVVFRNPVERALSEYAYFMRDEYRISSDAFGKLVSRQVAEFRDCRRTVRKQRQSQTEKRGEYPSPANQSFGDPFAFLPASAREDGVFECMYHRKSRCRSIRNGCIRLAYGIYSRPLAHWWSVFPRASLLILRSDELRSSPKIVLERVFTHLRLAPLGQGHDGGESAMLTATMPAHANVLAKTRRVVMTAPARRELEDFYRPFNRELAAMTGDNHFLWQYRPLLDRRYGEVQVTPASVPKAASRKQDERASVSPPVNDLEISTSQGKVSRLAVPKSRTRESDALRKSIDKSIIAKEARATHKKKALVAQERAARAAAVARRSRKKLEEEGVVFQNLTIDLPSTSAATFRGRYASQKAAAVAEGP